MKTSSRGVTTTVTAVAAIITLIIGVVIGVYAVPSPTPTDVVPLSEYNDLKSDYDEALLEIESLKTVGLSGEVKLGFLASMTGVLASFGENELAAAEFAAEQVNEMLASMGADWTIKIEVEDTQTEPDIALEKTESFAARGITLLVGPLSSAEVRAIKGYCDANKILAVSQSSTAPDLAIADDYIYRFCPTDELGQGPAMARIMLDDEKQYIIPVTRNDAWGIGLKEAGKKRFEELGGTFLEGIDYAPEAIEFSMEASNLAGKVSSAVDTYGADNVAVWHISFEEVNAFFTAANEYDVLSTVKWYGSDGTSLSGAILEDETVAEFAFKVGGYPCTIFTPTHSPKWEEVRQNNLEKIGREPDSYSYGVYDVVWAYAYSLLAVDKYDPEAVRVVLPTVTRSLFGASGWIDLNDAGDRKAGDYDIWVIGEPVVPGVLEWEHYGTWIFATDSVSVS
jgi:branched-chain amino acid transport system substrate-binding protein